MNGVSVTKLAMALGVLLMVAGPVGVFAVPTPTDEYAFTVSAGTGDVERASTVTPTMDTGGPERKPAATTTPAPGDISEVIAYEDLSPSGKDAFERALEATDGRVVLRGDPPSDFEYRDGTFKHTYGIDYRGETYALTTTVEYADERVSLAMRLLSAVAALFAGGMLTSTALVSKAWTASERTRDTNVPIGLASVGVLALSVLVLYIRWLVLREGGYLLMGVTAALVVASFATLTVSYWKKARS